MAEVIADSCETKSPGPEHKEETEDKDESDTSTTGKDESDAVEAAAKAKAAKGKVAKGKGGGATGPVVIGPTMRRSRNVLRPPAVRPASTYSSADRCQLESSSLHS